MCEKKVWVCEERVCGFVSVREEWVCKESVSSVCV